MWKITIVIGNSSNLWAIIFHIDVYPAGSMGWTCPEGKGRAESWRVILACVASRRVMANEAILKHAMFSYHTFSIFVRPLSFQRILMVSVPKWSPPEMTWQRNNRCPSLPAKTRNTNGAKMNRACKGKFTRNSWRFQNFKSDNLL